MFSAGRKEFIFFGIILLCALILEAKGEDETIEFTYIVEIVSRTSSTVNEQKICMGTILSQRHVLIPAGKLFTANKTELNVVYCEAGGPVYDVLSYEVEEIIFHPKYVPKTVTYVWNYDIGLILIRGSMSNGFNSGALSQINLPDRRPKIGQHCRTQNTGQYLNGKEFKNFGARLVSHDHCPILKYQYQYEPKKDNDRFICARHFGQIFVCKDNVGSPLICDGRVYGITSNGGCHEDNHTLYTNIFFHRDWIITTMQSMIGSENKIDRASD